MPHLTALTSLRFFAAFAVLLQHFTGLTGVNVGFAGAAHGVAFFFVLSGFILAYKYPQLATWKDRRTFLLARFARLWPAHAVSMLAVIVIFPQAFTWQFAGALATNLTMVQTWLPLRPFAYSINGPSWSISTEFFFYFAFLLLVGNLRRTWYWKLAITAAITGALIGLGYYFGLHWYKADRLISNDLLLYEFPLARLLEFTLGMCAALAWRTVRPYLPTSSAALWTLAELTAIALIVVASRSGLSYDTPFFNWYGSASITIPALFLICVMAVQAGWISRALSVEPFITLGEISYSVYLFHWVILQVALVKYPPTAQPVWIVFLICMAAILSISYLTWRFVEKPMRSWIRRLGSGEYGGGSSPPKDVTLPVQA